MYTARSLLPATTSPSWTLAAAVAYSIAAGLFVFSPVFPMHRLQVLHQATNGWLNPTLVLAALLGAGTFFLVFGPRRQRPADLGLRWAALPFGLAATFAVWLAMNASTALATRAEGLPLALHADWSGGGLLPGRLMAQLLGTALVEETVFRAWLWPQLALRVGRGAPRWPAWAAALLASQAMSALLHVPMLASAGTPGSALAGVLVNLFVFGVVAALLYAATRNLFFVVGLHALGNAPTLLMEVRGPAPTLVMLGAAILIAAGTYAARRRRGLPRRAQPAGA